MGYLIRCCPPVFTSSRQTVKLGNPQVKNNLKALEVSPEYFRGCFRPSSQPDGEMELQEESIVWKRSLAIRQKFSSLSLQLKNLGRKFSLVPLRVGLLKWIHAKWNYVLSFYHNNFFSHDNPLGHIVRFFFILFHLKNTYFYWGYIMVMLWQYSTGAAGFQSNLLYCFLRFETHR